MALFYLILESAKGISDQCIEKDNILDNIESLTKILDKLKFELVFANIALGDHLYCKNKAMPNIVDQHTNKLKESIEDLTLRITKTKDYIDEFENKINIIDQHIIILESKHNLLLQLNIKCTNEYDIIIEKAGNIMLSHINDVKDVREIRRIVKIVSAIILPDASDHSIEMAVDWIIKNN